MAVQYPCTKSKEFFRKIIFICYVSGLPNFWMENINLPKRFMKYHELFCTFFNKFLYFFVAMQLLSLYTQHDLSEKEQNYQFLFCVAHPFVVNFPTLMAHHKERLRSVLLEMLVNLKQVHNDLELEEQMIRQAKNYLIAFSAPFWISMVSYCCDMFVQVLKTGATFNVMVMVWPLVDDYSTLAALGRLIHHMIWILFETRVTATYAIVISLTTCVSYQFRNLQKYFDSLNLIFEENIGQNEKELKYEKMLRVGIHAHSVTLRVTKDAITVCSGVLSSQILFNIFFLVILMYQTVIQDQDRSLTKMFSNLCTAITLLFSTWFFACNAGDVTYEASSMATAMYMSGWHNCFGAALMRTKNLLIIALAGAQQPVIVKCFGIITLTHQAFLSIVKFSYSVFSLLY